jgi:uncharacterized protein YcbK (DUF882 family)
MARIAVSAIALLTGAHGLQNAVADGETRTLSLHHAHTGEAITVTYKRDGRYDEAALEKLNWLLRDWRREQQIRMDPHLFDVIWEVYREVGAKEPVEVVCGYRSPETNSMLRHRSRHSGVAQFSQHMLGRAMDFHIPGVALEDIRVAGLRLQRGGVGFYPTSGSPFVHLDTGNVRHWPRMTHEQLVRVFPDGKTVHVPSDGHPLPGYALALAEIERRGGSASATSAGESTDNDGRTFGSKLKLGFLAKLFGFRDHDEEEEADMADARPAAAPSPSPPPASVKPQLASVIPLPMVRPKHVNSPGTYALASIPSSPADDPATIVNARGVWGPRTLSPSSMVAASHASTPSPAPAPGAIGTANQRFAWITGPQGHPRETDDPIGALLAGSNEDRVPAKVALAYAAAPTPAALNLPRRAEPMGSLMSPKPTPSLTVPATIPSASRPVVPGEHFDDPWLRSLVVAPSLQEAMSVTVLGPTDYRTLQPLMAKPHTSVAMAFSDDPQSGLMSQAFEGAAVAFLPTVNFMPSRAAGLN